jgi:hypothetical protein
VIYLIRGERVMLDSNLATIYQSSQIRNLQTPARLGPASRNS